MIEFDYGRDLTERSAGPDLTPMIDMIFQLLIFFLLTSFAHSARGERGPAAQPQPRGHPSGGVDPDRAPGRQPDCWPVRR